VPDSPRQMESLEPHDAEMSVFSVQDSRGHGISNPRVMLGLERSNKNARILHADVNFPRVSRWFDAFVFGAKSIDYILRCRRRAYVFVSVIQAIAVNVVNVITASFDAEYFPVHEDHASSFSVLDGIAPTSIHFPVADCCVPTKLRKVLVAMGTDKCHVSSSQRYFTVGLFERGHGRSLQRLGFVRRLQRLTPSLYQMGGL
jgi:hypothetical protein